MCIFVKDNIQHILLMKASNKNIISFSSFDEQMARRLFGLKQEFKDNLLIYWENRAKKITISKKEQELMERIHHKLKIFIRGWNEEELKLKFIGHLIELVNYDDYDLEVAAFSERSLGITYKDTEIKGIADLMVATGISKPEQPFFFIHEYKREKDNTGDPVGQLLSTMVVAAELNKTPQPLTLFNQKKELSNIPLYGVYVLGRFWFFVVLKEQRYFISKAYDSTELNDVQEIFKLLKAQKEMIVELVKSVK